MSSIAAACVGLGCAAGKISTSVHVAGFNLGVLMRALHGQGTPRAAADARAALIFVLRTDALLVFGLIAVIDAEPAAVVVTLALAPTAN